MDEVFTQDDLADAERHETLGPAYMASQRIVREFMAKFEAENFKPLIDQFAKEFQDRLWSDLDVFLMSDTESNLQGAMWRQVDEMVRHLLAGTPWALQRYPLIASRYDGEKVREAITKHIPKELQDARIADLEAEVERLRKDLAFHRRN